VPELRIPEVLPEVPQYVCYGGFEFEAALTDLLLTGGAYFQKTIREEAARQMSRDFVDALAGERGQMTVWRLDEPWTDWFYDLVWDRTIVVLSLPLRRWGLLCVTDTD
jgi:hypothetical protein